jgi:histidinol phosphatase-like PHP family hydrolase/predicted MPP superfamily phosphohydrolase
MPQTPPPESLPQLCLLILADIHYVHHAKSASPIPARRSELGRELVRRACERARQLMKLDAVLMMGDLVDDGTAAGAREDLTELWEELRRPGLPVVVVRGNHDADLDAAPEARGQVACRVEIGGYQFVIFTDPYDPQDRSTRSDAALRAVREAAVAQPDRPIIALQHNPIHPPIESDYPFMPTNRDAIMAAYREAGVLLSISGHYHGGQSLSHEGGVGYVTAPALCEHPFCFLLVRLQGREVHIEEHHLALSSDRATPSLYVDHHCHTQFAYCRDDITATEAIRRAEEFGVAKLYLTEHAGQLYLNEQDYWGAAFLSDPDCYARERAAGRGRMDDYRRMVEPLRSDRVGLGLEVECDGAGRLTLLPQDADGWDVLVGAVHVVPELLAAHPDPGQVKREFMQFTETLLRRKVDILAHPFRLFRRAKLPVPAELFAPVADLLAEHGVAAEINFHINRESLEFIAMCLQRGVRITFGSDAHGLWEVGALWPHVELLEAACVRVAGGSATQGAGCPPEAGGDPARPQRR